MSEPESLHADRAAESIYERNLARLLRRAYRPDLAPEGSRARVLAALRRRQARGLGPAPLFTPWVAAAAGLVITAVLVFVSTADERARTSVVGEVRITRGAAITLELDEGASLALAGEGRPDRLLGGRCEIAVASGARHELEVGSFKIVTRGARIRVEVGTSTGAPNVPSEEESPMNRKVAGGAIAASAVLVTVAVLWLNEDEPPVSVDGPTGTVALERGETLVADGGGPIIARTDVAADGSASAPARVERTGPATGSAPAPAVPAADAREIRGIVQDDAEHPLAGATIAFRVDGGTSESAIVEAKSAADGTFLMKIPGVAKSARVETALPRYETATVEWSAPDEEPAEDPIAGAEKNGTVVSVPDIVVTLLHETAIGGIVRRAADGEPLAGFLVSIQQYDLQTHRWFEPKVERFEGDDGRFYFGGIQPGNYHVWAYQEGMHRSEAINVTVAANEFREGVEPALSPGYSLRGTVFAKHDGKPVAGAVVYLPKGHLPGSVNYIERTFEDTRVRDSDLTDAGGRFELDDLAPGKDLAVRVLHSDYRPVDVRVELGPGVTPPEIEVTLQEGTRFFGKVLDEEGNPRVGAGVLAFTMSMDMDLAESAMSQVDEEGSYELRHLNPGLYIVIRLKDLENDSDPTNFKMNMSRLEADRDTELDFTEVVAPQFATLRGRVFDESGKPLASVGLSATSIESGDLTFEVGNTDAEGRYEIRNLRLMGYSISVALGEARAFSVVGEMRFDKPIDYERDFVYHDLEVEGKVTEESGAPVVMGELIVLRSKTGADGKPDPAAGQVFSGRGEIDATGGYEIAGLPPGEYRMLVTAPGFRRTMSKSFALDTTLHRRSVVDIVLEAGGGVRVRVLDPSGAPVAGALVTILDGDGDPANQGLPPKTEADGTYSYTSLGAGSYTAQVTYRDKEPVRAAFAVTAGNTETVEIRLAQ